ncbi:MBL fold metallo-hydrolase [Sphingobacterium sp. lm-10]|uniref:MBL fold metallo-hydrolase n=1 Tax=Sphingobacterium sp. lm-10 TaxID=2944904 RepID=UPI00202216F4|nr:MBL fold metallo-hydrolase [Sphingobacterium sp. lm-10]MCL7987276.1 MBL fold metallo-hydrolase [Sphingobacterium sp. lm-10]
MITTLVIISALLIATMSYMQQNKFGKNPSGARLERIKHSPNYRDGQFQNLSKTTTLADGHNYFEVLYTSYIKYKPRKYPIDSIPSIKTDLLSLPVEENLLVWFGHSSYFIQIDGKRILVDPVFSGNASPIPGTVKSFNGTDIYAVSDLPNIDYLFISHDHYDHVDYETLIALKEKTMNVICGLGVGAHLEHWGYDSNKIFEGDWGDRIVLGSGFTAFVESARHFSGRGFSTNKTLWASYVLHTPTMKIYMGGDSGYDRHYAEIGNKHGSFDLAILDNGQYDEAWKYIHHLPEDVLKAANDLRAKRILPVHSSKFVLGSHDWDEPLSKITELNKSYNIPLLTPMIGEVVYLNDKDQQFTSWWLGLK